MIKHIVLWKLKDHAEGRSKAENALELKRQVEALNGRIPGLRKIEVGLNVRDRESGDSDADVVLYAEFYDLAAVEAYYPHPEHARIKPFARAIRSGRMVINYER